MIVPFVVIETPILNFLASEIQVKSLFGNNNGSPPVPTD